MTNRSVLIISNQSILVSALLKYNELSACKLNWQHDCVYAVMVIEVEMCWLEIWGCYRSKVNSSQKI